MSPVLRHRGLIPRLCRHFFLLAGALALTAAAADKKADKPAPEFGADVQLAPFVVNGKKLSISIYARTASDRKYAEAFAEDVVGVAYETIEKSTGDGLVIIGREGEPHPLVVFRKFQAMAAAGLLDPAIAAKAGELTALIEDWKKRLDMKEDPGEKGFKVTLDMIVPALPLPLEGMASKLYQLSWTENFDDARIEQRLRALTVADLASDALSKYDWVFYLPPRNAFKSVEDDIIKQAEQHEKMGLFKRAALRSALFVFSPALKTAVEGMRKGMLYLTVLRAKSGYNQGDTMALTGAYTKVLMPDFKFTSGTEHERVLKAIEEAKLKNAEYAKDPYVSPPRLTTFDPAAYAIFEGDYGAAPVNKDGKPGKPSRAFAREGEAWLWQYRNGKPQTLYPAGDRLLVSADGKMTVGFKLDEKGVVIGVEERRERHRQTFPRRAEVAPAPATSPAP